MSRWRFIATPRDPTGGRYRQIGDSRFPCRDLDIDLSDDELEKLAGMAAAMRHIAVLLDRRNL